MAGDRETIVTFLRSFATELATRVDDLPYGAGLFNPAIPNVWDFNIVWVDAAPAWLDASRLIADAERLHAAAGVRHRQIVVAAGSSFASLAHGLRSSGFARRRHLLMVARRDPDRAPGADMVEELGIDDLVRFTRRELRQAEASAELKIAEIVESKRIVARAGARFFGVRKRRSVVSACDLYVRGDLAQIEAVVTERAHRNRGYARAVVLHAASEARRAGARLVFLQAEEDDWPKELYRRLGFDEVGTISLFLRTPDRLRA